VSEYRQLITSAIYSAITTYGKDTTKLRVFAQDYVASLNRKGIIPNEEVDKALKIAYGYIEKQLHGEPASEEASYMYCPECGKVTRHFPLDAEGWVCEECGLVSEGKPRRMGKPLTEEERRERHYERYGTTELPPRGTGLRKPSASRIPTCPICGKPMKRIIGNLYQCPEHPTQTESL